MRWCWVNFQCRGVLLTWIIVGQRPIGLAVGAGGGCLDIFLYLSFLSSFSLSLGDGPIQTEILSQRAAKPKTTNQPNLALPNYHSVTCFFLFFSFVTISKQYIVFSPLNMSLSLFALLVLQSTLVISNLKGPSETLRDIRTSTYQIFRIEENTNRTTKFNK